MPAESMSSSGSASKPVLSTSPQPPRKNFDIDDHLNHLIPRPRFHLLPEPIARILGHRHPSQPQAALRTSLTALYALLGAFSGIALTTYIFHVLPPLVPLNSTSSTSTNSSSGLSSSSFHTNANPVIIASLGATAILEYNALHSPLAQPRSLLLGQAISATIGILITKAFMLLPVEQFEDLRWLAGSLAVGISSAVMTVTKTVHPPAGATALLAATSPDITQLGWYLLALVELGSLIMLLVALAWGNVHIERRFPQFWWTEHDLSSRDLTDRDEEKGQDDDDEEVGEMEMEMEMGHRHERVLVVPQDFEISEEEATVLAGLRERLRANGEAMHMPPEVRARLRANDVARHMPPEVRGRT